MLTVMRLTEVIKNAGYTLMEKIIETIFEASLRPLEASCQHHFTKHDTFTFSQCS